MKKLFLFALIAFLISSCNNEEKSGLVIPDGCDTTGIYLSLDSCRLANPRNQSICLTQQYLDEWCSAHH